VFASNPVWWRRAQARPAGAQQSGIAVEPIKRETG
jgi:hypothetical protein